MLLIVIYSSFSLILNNCDFIFSKIFFLNIRLAFNLAQNSKHESIFDIQKIKRKKKHITEFETRKFQFEIPIICVREMILKSDVSFVFFLFSLSKLDYNKNILAIFIVCFELPRIVR